jgi:ABC-type cobalamin/Fe3+-siderophores transport system ATPase subunit
MELLSEIHRSANTTIIFVTHNPELTRYATRVVYMHDGAIIHDEKTSFGSVAPRARQVLYTLPVKTVEDDLAGVSALMKAIPSKPSKHRTKKRKRTTAGKGRVR